MCSIDALERTAMTDPHVYLWPQANCGGTPIKLGPSSGITQNIQDFVDSGVSPLMTQMRGNKLFPPEQPGMLQTQSVYIPPTLEVDWTSNVNLALDSCGQNGWCTNQGSWKWDQNRGSGFFSNLRSDSGYMLGTRVAPRPIDDSTSSYQGKTYYLNRVRSARVRQKQTLDKWKINCCRGLGDKAQCGTYWGPDGGGECDGIMTDWCHWNPTHPDCACITSEIPNAQCFDQKCTASSAYRSQNQKAVLRGGCPLEVTCSQVINLSDDAKHNLINGVQMVQKCTAPTVRPQPGASGQIHINDSSSDWPAGVPPPTDPRWSVVTYNSTPPVDPNQVMAFILIVLLVLYLTAQIQVFDSGLSSKTSDDWFSFLN